MTETELIHQGWADWGESFHTILLEDPPIWNDTRRPLTAQECKGWGMREYPIPQRVGQDEWAN